MGNHKSHSVLDMDATDYVRGAAQAKNATKNLGNQVTKTDAKLGLLAKQSKRVGKSLRDDLVKGTAGVTAGVTTAVFAFDRWMERQVQVTNVTRNLRISVDEAAEAVDHQTSKFEIARQAQKLYDSGNVKTSQELARLEGTIAGLADRAGVDLVQSMDGATKSILKGNDRIFEQLGLTSDLEAEQRLLASQLGKTVAELSDYEKSQLVLNLLLEKGEAALANNTEQVHTAAHSWASWKNQLVDWLDEVPNKMGQSVNQMGDDVENFSINALQGMGMLWEEATTNTRRFESALGDLTDVAIAQATFDIDKLEESLGKLNRTFSTFGKIANSQAVDSARATQEAEAEEVTRAANALAQQARQAQRDKLLQFHQSGKKKKGKGRGGRGRGAATGPSDSALGRRRGGDAFATESLELELLLLDQQIEVAQAKGQEADALFERRFERAQLLAQAEGDAGSLAQVRHDEEMRLIQEEIEAKEELEARKEAWLEAQRRRAEEEIALRMQVLDVTVSTVDTTLGVISQGVEQYAKTEEQRLMWEKGAEALSLGTKAVAATSKSVAAFAAYNFPQGFAHAAEAAALTAGVTMVLARPANPSAGLSGGGGSAPSPFAGVGQRGGRGAGSAPEIPISPAELGQPAEGASGTQNVTINVTGMMDEQGARTLARELRKVDRFGAN